MSKGAILDSNCDMRYILLMDRKRSWARKVADMLDDASWKCIVAINVEVVYTQLSLLAGKIRYFILDLASVQEREYQALLKHLSSIPPPLKPLTLLQMTERTPSLDLVYAFEAGADHCIQKPFGRTELLEALEVAASGSSLYRALCVNPATCSKSIIARKQ